MALPTCSEHPEPIVHPPVLCHTELVWHPVVCVPKAREKVVTVRGTHGGVMGERPTKRIVGEARDRRITKNARNRARNRGGDGLHARGSQRRRGRLEFVGNRRVRGIGA